RSSRPTAAASLTESPAPTATSLLRGQPMQPQHRTMSEAYNRPTIAPRSTTGSGSITHLGDAPSSGAAAPPCVFGRGVGRHAHAADRGTVATLSTPTTARGGVADS